MRQSSRKVKGLSVTHTQGPRARGQECEIPAEAGSRRWHERASSTGVLHTYPCRPVFVPRCARDILISPAPLAVPFFHSSCSSAAAAAASAYLFISSPRIFHPFDSFFFLFIARFPLSVSIAARLSLLFPCLRWSDACLESRGLLFQPPPLASRRLVSFSAALPFHLPRLRLAAARFGFLGFLTRAIAFRCSLLSIARTSPPLMLPSLSRGLPLPRPGGHSFWSAPHCFRARVPR